MPSSMSTTVARSIGSLAPLGHWTWTSAFGSSDPAVNTPRGRAV
jgi:hypothetical protein